ncbi:MAG TPA: hypothetical protein VM487_11640, partial [Phycisphaerae bacterium]|nr:hypothetical protein [Phycisphaerae bacterium]
DGGSAGPINGMWLRRVNIRYNEAGAPRVLGPWFYTANGGDTAPNTAERYGSHLDQVYYIGDPVDPWENYAGIPGVLSPWGPTLESDALGEYLDYSGVPDLQINGIIREGPPPNGDFAIASKVGLNYVSPWGTPT